MATRIALPIPMALPKTLDLNMAREDIDDAICNSRTKCAIVLTIYRSIGKKARVSTAGASIDGGDGYRYHYRVPLKACRLVRQFDEGKEVDPIPFTLRFTNRIKVQTVSPERRRQMEMARELRKSTEQSMAMNGAPRRRGRYGI